MKRGPRGAKEESAMHEPAIDGRIYYLSGYDEAAAKLAWQRVAFFEQHLA